MAIIKETVKEVVKFAPYIVGDETTFVDMIMKKKNKHVDTKYVSNGVRVMDSINKDVLGENGEEYDDSKLTESDKILVENTCQEIRRWRKIPDGVASNKDYIAGEIEDAILELKTVMDYQFLYANTAKFKGVAFTTGIKTASLASNYTLNNLRDAIVSAGGKHDTILLNSKTALKISDMYKTGSTKMHQDVVVNFDIKKMIVLNQELDILIDNNVKDDEFFVFAKKDFDFHYVKDSYGDRDIYVEEMGRSGANTKVMIDTNSCVLVDYPMNTVYIKVAV